jgi:HEAT repeat protein
MSALSFESAEAALRVLLDNEREESERIEAASALGTMGDAASVMPMFGALDSSETGLGLAIAAALKELNAGTLLASDLKLGDVGKRRLAALCLVRLGDARTLDALVEASGDEDTEVRAQVYEALARLEGPEALGALRKGLTDASPDVRGMAAYGVGVRGDETDVATLERVLEGEEDVVAKTFLRQALKRLRGRL